METTLFYWIKFLPLSPPLPSFPSVFPKDDIDALRNV